MTDRGRRYRVTLEPIGACPELDLRRLVKRLGRQYGLRVVGLEIEAPAGDSTPTNTDPQATLSLQDAEE